MRLTTLSDNVLLIEQHMTMSKSILRESCDGLTVQQRTIVEGIYKEFVPLIEATLTADQIKQVFGELEKQSIAGGQNRTIAGAGVDVAREANKVIDNIGKWLQNTAPVKAFDQKFEDLKNKINTKFPDSKLLDSISEMGIWAKENPGKTAAIIGVLTAIASLAGGPVGGAIAGQVLKGSVELLKGEKLSTAIGKGLKAAAVGWLAGKSMEAVGKMISGAYEHFNPVPIKGEVGFSEINIGNGLPSTFQNAKVYGSKEQLDQFQAVWEKAVNQWNTGNFEGAKAAFDNARQYADQISNATIAKIAVDGNPADSIRALNNALSGLSAAAQGAATGATGFDKKGQPVQAAQESFYIQTRPLSEGQVYMVFNRIIAEAGMWDKAKELGGKALGAVSKGAEWAGKQATEKVTSAKLLTAWKLEGSPTDSEEFKRFLLNYGGIDQTVIDQVFKDLKINGEGAATAVTYKEVAANIEKLDKKGKQRILAYLQKQSGTAK